MRTLFCLLLVLLSFGQSKLAHAATDPVLDEIKANIEDSKKKIEEGKKQISALEDNEKKIHDNLESLAKSLQKKQTESRDAREVLGDYTQKLGAAGQAKKDFEKSVAKDKSELALVDHDIVAVQKKLVALQAAKKALQESIEIAEENLSKMDDRSGTWQRNKNKVTDEAGGIQKDLDALNKKKEEQEKLSAENQAALSKWRRAILNQETNLQKIENRYKSAISDAEKAQKGR